jgi:hypothetical protein
MARLREPDQLPAEAERIKLLIEQGSARFPQKQCVKCAGGCFRRHQKRRRWFLPVVDRMVRPIHCWLYRWCCASCGTGFTHLPTLCVPFKRYLRGEIEKRARTYVQAEATSYRRAVRDDGWDVVYDGPVAVGSSTEAEKEAEVSRALAPSTLHRWIGCMAACRERWQPVVRLAGQIRREAPPDWIAISASKYRSRARKRVLETCALLLRAISIVAGKNPTRFATMGSSP